MATIAQFDLRLGPADAPAHNPLTIRTDEGHAIDTQTAATPPSPSTNRAERPARWTIAGVVAVLIGGCLAALAWQWRHPQVFYPVTDGGMETRTAGEVPSPPMYFGMTVERDREAETVTITGLQAHVLRDTANARIRFYVCVSNPTSSNELLSTAYESRLPAECSGLSPDIETTINLNANPRQRIVMSVELREPGVVEIQGMDMTYRNGWQNGTQRVGSHVLLRSR